MKRCRKCNREFDDQMGFCSFDGQSLQDINLIDGKYRLEKKIGEGGMGQVFAATHIHLKATVAVKILHSSFVNNEQAVERFRREAEAAANIKHANAITVTDFGLDKENGIVYFVMEYLDGLTLRQYLNQCPRLAFHEIYHILSQLCGALQTAHEKGILHRDLKPDNIFLVKAQPSQAATTSLLDYRIKVLDFGLAKLKHYDNVHLTAEGKILGTLNYMSPEQVMSLDVAATTDIYSLGVILYEMIAGVRPYKVKDHLELIMRQFMDDIRPLRELRPDVPASLAALVLRALNRDTRLRQASMRELFNEYEQCLQIAGIAIPKSLDVASTKIKQRSRIMNEIWHRLADEPTVAPNTNANNNSIDHGQTINDDATGSVEMDTILLSKPASKKD